MHSSSVIYFVRQVKKSSVVPRRVGKISPSASIGNKSMIFYTTKPLKLHMMSPIYISRVDMERIAEKCLGSMYSIQQIVCNKIKVNTT
uniref:Putative ovule protein n=1 Tax=Solanum chacoense TaxID=4108 RepID=A0A0V0GL61_SOLCH